MVSRTLPAAEWRRDPRLARIVAALGEVRFVGGVVRDALLGEPIGDIDLATPLPPQEVIGRLTAAGLNVVPTGLDHGTVTAVADGLPAEVTTLRRDVATDGRRAVVAFTPRWEEDAARRDFTINALYAEPDSGRIHDYFGGLDDLAARRVRFIGEADQRIAEDHLRILRYFRFLARFGRGEPDDQALAACRRAADRLKALSRERVGAETGRLLAAADPGQAIALMVETDVLRVTLPEAPDQAVAQLATLVARERSLGVRPDPLRRLLALLPREPELVDKVAARLRFSNRQRAELLARLAVDAQAPAPAQAYRHGAEAVRDAALLWADKGRARAVLDELRDFQPPRFPLSGRHLIERGLSPGPLVARTLRAVEEQWIAERFPDYARLGRIADQAVEAARKA